MKDKTIAVTILTMMCLAFVASSLPPVTAQSGPVIYQITQKDSFTSIDSGNVGLEVNLIAGIETSSGPYKVYFDKTLVDSNNAEGFYVSSNFTIPEVPSGSYNVTIIDDTLRLNATKIFVVLTGYNIKAQVPAAPAQLQEGANIIVNVNVTGGDPNTSYGANVTLMLPAPLSTNYTQIVTIQSNAQGTAKTQLTFPGESFQPSGSTTVYAGTYTAYFNQTLLLAQDPFSIGFTDKSEYHRQDNVAIRAVGYQANQAATLKIQSPTGAELFNAPVTASADGVITANWTVPANAPVGTSTATITPQGVAKSIPDSQSISIPGFPITVRALNIAGALATDVEVESLDQATNTIISANYTSGGYSLLYLEKGDQTLSAYWNGVKVGSLQITVTGGGNFDLTTNLANLNIRVRDKNGIVIPLVNLTLTYSYVSTKTGATEFGNSTGQTDTTGNFTFSSLLPGINYNLGASKYNVKFNAGNDTITNLPAQAAYQVTILCPDRSLSINAVDFNRAALVNARVELVEQASGIFYSTVTDAAGNVNLEVTFGQYRLRIYTGSVLLNETVVNVFSDAQTQVQCSLYNLRVTVKVVDYFGNPVGNVNIRLNRQGTAIETAITQSNGLAVFNNVIGGSLEVTAEPAGSPGSFVAINVQVDSPAAIVIRLDKYVAFGSALIETSLLVTLLITVAGAIVLALMELNRRKMFSLLRRGKNSNVQS